MKEPKNKYECILSLLEDSILGSWRDIIVETLMRIPFDVLRKVWEQGLLDRIIIVGENDNAMAIDILWQCMSEHEVEMQRIEGYAKPVRIIKPVKFRKWFIILNESSLKKFDKETQMSIIAHEFAHVYLKHSRIGRDATSSLKNEEEANRLIKEWGFKKL